MTSFWRAPGCDSVGYWGRLCKPCEVVTGESDSSWPHCWNCDALLVMASEYDPLKMLGRSPSMYQGALVSEVMKRDTSPKEAEEAIWA